MGFKTGDFPPVDPTKLFDMPYLERVKLLSRHWVDYGFGAPKMTHVIYLAKLLFLYIVGGLLVSSLTSGPESARYRVLVDRARLLPEGDLVDHAAGVPGNGWVLGSDGRPLQAVHVWPADLPARGHHPPAAVAPRPTHRRRPPYVLRRAPLRRGPGHPRGRPGAARPRGRRPDRPRFRRRPGSPPLVATVLVVLMVTLGLRDKAFFLQGARRAVPTSKPHYAALNPQAQPI
jgi:hypothetical protein